MFCPTCKSEYRDGFTRCSDCNTVLVPELPKPADGFSGLLATIVWSGGNPAKLAGVKAALDGAGIPYAVTTPKSRLFFASMQPVNEVRVVSSNESRALELIAEQVGDDAALNDDPSKDEYILEAQDGVEFADTDTPEFAPENWDPELATFVLWTGNDIDLAENIQASLKENGIGSQKISDAEPIRLMIYPADEGRAREILREIAEGAPPA